MTYVYKGFASLAIHHFLCLKPDSLKLIPLEHLLGNSVDGLANVQQCQNEQRRYGRLFKDGDVNLACSNVRCSVSYVISIPSILSYQCHIHIKLRLMLDNKHTRSHPYQAAVDARQ